MNYSEGIYVGYKFYETAAAEGPSITIPWLRSRSVYGLSYTTFEQKLNDVTYKDGKVTVDVTVTNTGDTAGKDVVEVYYSPPLHRRWHRKKRPVHQPGWLREDQELKPGASETVTVEFDDDDMASYDYKNAQGIRAGKGDYNISISSDSHA